MIRLSLVVLIACSALSDSHLVHAAKEQDSDDSTRQERIKRMHKFVRSLSVVELPKRRQARELSPHLALVYADAARQTSDSTLWLWTEDGRPRAMTTIEYYPRRSADKSWSFEFASLSQHPLTMIHFDAERWHLEKPGETDEVIPSAGAPSENRIRRLQQMKQIARRFRAITIADDSGRTELRLLPNPVYRSPESETDAADAAVFVFSYGTNPEVILLVESVTTDTEAEWRYSLAPATSIDIVVTLDGTEIWSQPQFTGPGTRDAYTNGLFSIQAD